MRPFDARLLRIVPQARAGVVGLFLLGAVQGIATIGQAFGIAALVVAVAQGTDWQLAAGGTIVAFTVRALAAGGAEWLAAHAGALVSTTVRRRLLASALGRDAADADRGGRLVTLAGQGATSLEPYVARYLPTLAAAGFLPPVAILAMLLLDWRTGLIPILTVPLLPVFAALIGSATAEATDRRWRTLARLSGHFLDVMRGLPTLVSYGRAERQIEVIRTVSHDHRRATVATLRLAFLSSAALELLATISVAIVAVWVGIQLAQGDMTLSLAMPLILLAPEAYWPIRRVGAEFHNAADGAAAIAEIAHQLDVPARAAVKPPTAGDQATESAADPSTGTAQPPTGTAQPATGTAQPATTGVRLADLSYAYADDAPDVLHRLTFAPRCPGLTVVTGPSGVGKTTLLEILAGLRRPRTGSLIGRPGYLVTQRPFLAPATLRENLVLGVPLRDGRPPADGRLNKALADVGLADFVRTLPRGLNTPLGDDGFGLSAGQRARIALARALLADPQVLLLDEPTAHLDPESERIVADMLTELARSRTVVAVSHREGLLRRADATLTLEPSS